MELKGKNAVITGGAMGIGLATAKLLVSEGCNVTLWDINDDELQRAKTDLDLLDSKDSHDLKGKVFTYYCDVTDKKRVAELADKAEAEMGSIDILINNAGYVKGGDFLDQPDELWVKTIDVNVNAIIYTISAVLPKMNKRNIGHIVNISSAAGILGVPGISVYSASKWAVWGLTESMRLESYNQGKHGIKWTSIHPSYLAQGMFEGAKLNFLGNMIVPLVKNHEVIAKAIVFGALKKGKSVVRRPRTLRIAILLRGLLPEFLFQKLMILLGVNRSMKTWKGREKL
jgi:all-trans-retinol dehydrogenase (NAD+)